MTRKYLKLEIGIEKQICPFLFREKLQLNNFVSRSTDLYKYKNNLILNQQQEKEAANLAHAMAHAAKSRTSIAANPKSSFQAYGGREITKTGVSIQPKGTFKLDSKISLGSYNNSDTPKNGDLETSGVTSKSSYSSYSMTSSSSRSLFK